MGRLGLAMIVVCLTVLLFAAALLLGPSQHQLYSLPVMLAAVLPLTAFLGDLAWRDRHSRGTRSIRFDDRLGEGPLPELVRQTLHRHTDLIAANLPGTLDRFTLTVLDAPIERVIRFPRNVLDISACTYYPIDPRARALMHRRGFRVQTLVSISAISWEPRLEPSAAPSRESEWYMAVTLHHEFCHVFLCPHPLMRRMEKRFACQLRYRLASTRGPGSSNRVA